MNISKYLINGFIKTELDLFKEHFDEASVPEIQDDRSLAIAWMCYFFKDSINSENTLAITNFVTEVITQKNYHIHGWYRISALQTVAFILSSDKQFALSLVQHIDCEQSWVREFILGCTGIICPLLSFKSRKLEWATENNMRLFHGLAEENIILYLSTSGSAEEKRKWWQKHVDSAKNEDFKEFLLGLKEDGEIYESSFFISYFNRAKSYILFKMLSQPSIPGVQSALFDEDDISFSELYEKEKAHPLSGSFIDLSFLKSEE